MITVLSWNVQYGRGVDGRIDLSRIAATIRALGGADVLCLQEVARRMPEIDGGRGADQLRELAALFPDHEAHFGPALDLRAAGGDRSQFGNLVLSRLPVLQLFRHPLPQPADPDALHMPRQAIEAVVAAPSGPLRMITTHLEYHSERQRTAQAVRLRELQREVAENAARPPRRPDSGPYADRPRPARCVLCGDLNSLPGDAVLRRLLEPLPEPLPGFRDAWPLAHGDRPHAPTCGLFDRQQWPEGPHCRDFFLVSADLAEAVADLRVEDETGASDHQPLLLTLRL